MNESVKAQSDTLISAQKVHNPTRTSVTEKFKDLKIGTVFEYHVYDILGFH